jgi:hypothetical protein
MLVLSPSTKGLLKLIKFLSKTLIGILIAGTAAAYENSLKPVVRYSETGGTSSTAVGAFDVTYLDASVPLGSELILHFGFEVSDNFSDDLFVWSEPNTGPMKNWEEFGWFTRIEFNRMPSGMQKTVVGLDFVVEVKPPGASRYFINGGTSESSYFKVQIPGPESCSYTSPSYRSGCATSVEVADHE